MDRKFETILFTKKNGYGTIVLNRPQKKNALTEKSYEEIITILEGAVADTTISFLVITGAGDFFCSGNDLSNFTKTNGELSKKGIDLLEKFLNTIIDFPKPIAALINGPAVGIAVAFLPLFDFVYASDKATFASPFAAFGLTPEACSSYTFPKLMGRAKANELLVAGRKINATEALERGLVNEVISAGNFEKETNNRLNEFSKISSKILLYAKKTLFNMEKDVLHTVNKEECALMVELVQGKEYQDAVKAFINRKK